MLLAEGITGYHLGIGKASALCRLPPRRGAAMARPLFPQPADGARPAVGREEPAGACGELRATGSGIPPETRPSRHAGEAKGIAPCGEVKPLGKKQHSQHLLAQKSQVRSHGGVWRRAVWGRKREWAGAGAGCPRPPEGMAMGRGSWNPEPHNHMAVTDGLHAHRLK